MDPKPFSPAMNAAVNLLSAEYTRQINQLVSEEAESLGLPEGTQADIQARVWQMPDLTKPVE